MKKKDNISNVISLWSATIQIKNTKLIYKWLLKPDNHIIHHSKGELHIRNYY